MFIFDNVFNCDKLISSLFKYELTLTLINDKIDLYFSNSIWLYDFEFDNNSLFSNCNLLLTFSNSSILFL